jgi:hypothetical protein
MFCKSASSTQDEVPHLFAKEQEQISEPVHEAVREYQLAKQDLENFVHAMRACRHSIAAADGILLLNQLSERERNAVVKVAQTSQDLYDQNEGAEEFAA